MINLSQPNTKPTASPVERNLPHHALVLPEILRMILECLEDNEDALLSVILVNRMWAEEGLNIYWRAPPVVALAAVPHDRRQYYADKIEELDFWDEEAKHSVHFVDLAFPRLSWLDMCSLEDTPLSQYMVPKLERFFLSSE